jgi:hypothetical protein
VSEPDDRPRRTRVIVPFVLAVTVVTTIAAAVSTTASCTSSSKPHVDAGTGDAPSDTPII